MFENPLSQDLAEEARRLSAPTLPVLSSTDPAADAHRKLVAAWQDRIQRALFGITEKIDRQARPAVERYLRHVSYQMANNADSQFPTSLNASRDPERYTARTCPGILHFHIGNAILAFYSLCMTGEVSPILEVRVELIEEIAKCGLKPFIVMGNDREGFTLIHRDKRPIPFHTGPQIEDGGLR